MFLSTVWFKVATHKKDSARQETSKKFIAFWLDKLHKENPGENIVVLEDMTNAGMANMVSYSRWFPHDNLVNFMTKAVGQKIITWRSKNPSFHNLGTILSTFNPTLTTDVMLYNTSMSANVSTTSFCSSPGIFLWIDNSASISVLRNIRYTVTSHSFLKWDKV